MSFPYVPAAFLAAAAGGTAAGALAAVGNKGVVVGKERDDEPEDDREEVTGNRAALSASAARAPAPPTASGPSRTLTVPQPGRRVATANPSGWTFPKSEPRHVRSFSTSPSPPTRAVVLPSSPSHRRLSNASLPRNTQSLHIPDFPALDRATSGTTNYTASDHDECPVDIDHPLQAQIDQLLAKCREHELKFRSAKASFEHRVMTEFPSFLHQLTVLDDRAERASASIYAAIKASKPELHAKLQQLLEEGEGDVETMRERTTPWRDVLESATPPDEDDAASMSTKIGYGAPLARTRSGDSRRLLKIERMKEPLKDEDTEKLSLLEHYGEGVIHHLSEQIENLKRQRTSEGFRRYIILRTIATIVFTVAVCLGIYGFRRSPEHDPEPLTLESS